MPSDVDMLPLPEAVASMYAGQLPESYILPLTKVPALHPSHTPDSDSGVDGPFRSHRLRRNESASRQDVAGSVQRYANAVMAFTGLDDIAFLLVATALEHEQEAVVHAVAEEDALRTSVKVFSLRPGAPLPLGAQLDFVLHFNASEQKRQWKDAGFVLELSPGGDGNSLSYDGRLIPEPAAPSIAHAFEGVLESLDAVETLENDEQLLSITNFPPSMTPPPIPQDQTGIPSVLLHSDFERRAAEVPDRPALDFLHGGRHTILSYAELDAAANSLAGYILDNLGQPGTQQRGGPDILPFYLSPSPELYIAYLGVLKSGYGFCPLPLDAPEDRLRDILDDLAPRAVLGSGAPEARPNALQKLDWIDVTQVSRTTDGVSTRNGRVDEADVAYVMYTSGSTGRPKGVQIQHLASTCSIRSHAATLPLSNNPDKPSRWFQFAASTFDPSIMEIFVTWSSGATLCSADRQLTLSDPEGTVTALAATVMMTTPSVASLLRPDKLPTLRSLWTMGEALTRKVIDNFAVAPPSRQPSDVDGPPRGLANAYGPTEASINCTLLPAVDPRHRGSVIGPPLPTASLLVLDPSSPKIPRPVPAGFAGELAVAGPQLSRGYLNRPAETAAAFVHSDRFGRLYRTGDRARVVWDVDGNMHLEFLGRISSGQVKLNGRRAELGEVESVLAQVSTVAEVAVAVAKGPGSRHEGSMPQLVALLVLGPDQRAGSVVEACRARARSLLPDFLRPACFEVVASLPRLASAKVDRKRVAAVAQEVVDEAAAASAGAVSEQQPAGAGAESFGLVRRLVAETTGVDAADVHPEAGLFSLGLDSLRCMALLQKLREHSKVPVSVAEVLQCRTVAGFAALLAEKQAAAADFPPSAPGEAVGLDTSRLQLEAFANNHKRNCAESLDVAEHEIEAVYPPTATQSGMLASFVRSSSNSSACRTYINHSVFDIRGDVDLKKLQSAWVSVLSRHEAFRTVFVPVDDDMAPFAQCVLSRQSQKVKVTWRARHIPEVTESGLGQHIRHELRSIETEISLDDPPYRLTVMTSKGQRVIVISLFHAIFDGGSLQLLLGEVDAEYHGKDAPRRTPLSKAVDTHHLADHDRHGAFWSRYLDGVTTLPFPNLTGLRPEARDGLPQTEQVESTVPLTRLRDAAKTMGTSVLALLQASWLVILSSYSGSLENVVFGSVISGRFDEELEVCMAPTFATVPVRSPVADMESTSFRDVARKLARTNAESLGHLQAKIGSVTSPSGQLPYDTLFAFQEFGVAGEQSGIWKSIEYPPMANDFAVMVEVWPSMRGTITLKVTFTDAHLNHQSAGVMLNELNDVLDHIILEPNQPFVSGLSAPRPSLLSTHSASETELRKVAEDTSLLHSQLEENARNTPDDTALVFVTAIDPSGHTEQITWTYAELDYRASQFSSKLRACFGNLNAVYVPLCLEKSPALYVALLGILKAGGAWCPVDPLFPPRRRHDLILRTKAPMVIVDAGRPQLDEGVPRGIRKVEVNYLGQWMDPMPVQESNLSERPASPEDPAYLIWTSGTTGSPKGVPIHHRAAVASMSALQHAVPGNRDGTQVRCMQFSQFTFDVFVQDLFYTWGFGGAVISSTRDIMMHSFSELATAARATHAHLTPAFAVGIERVSCPSLNVVTFIGEKLPQHVADNWSRDATIAFNTYGPAETTVVSTLRQFGGGGSNAIASSNIGVPLPSVGAHVLLPRNGGGKPVLRHAVGELALSGPQLSAGYLDSPDKTAAAFVWNEHLGRTVYRTGDLVRQLHDGSLDFVGRADDLVKLGGIRVELSEIEFALRECHPAVHQVSIQYLSRPDRIAKIVIAFLAAPRLGMASSGGIVTNPAAAAVARAALEKARLELPEHMVPGAFFVVREIPRTRSAKVDRDALRVMYETVDLRAWESMLDHDPQPDDTAPDADVAAVHGSKTATELFVMRKIRDLTGARLEAMTARSKLAALGVDSIAALRLAARLKADGCRVSVADMIASNTVQGLVNLVGRASSEGHERTAADRLHAFHLKWAARLGERGMLGRFRVVPALPLQESLLSESIRDAQAYWSNHAFELNGSVEPRDVFDAWEKVVRDNDILRASFFPTAELDHVVADESTPSFLQIIQEEPPVDSKHISIAPGTLVDEAKKRASAIAIDRQQTGFRSPLSAITVFDEGGKCTLMLTLHHAIHDGPAMQYIFSDLQRACLGRGCLPRPQWSQALGLTRFASDQSPQATLGFWKKELEVFAGGGDARTFPDLSCRRSATTADAKPEFLDCTITLTESVQSLLAFSGAIGAGSAVSAVRAAFACTLAEYLESASVFFGETFSDRIANPELADVVGPLISVVPVTFHAAGTAREAVARQAAMVDASVVHRHVHPRAIKRLVNCQPSQPLYCAMFAYHPETADGEEDAIWTRLDEFVPLTVEHPIALNVEQRGGSLRCTFSALDSVMNADHLGLFARQVDALVGAMVRWPDSPVADLADRFPKSLLSVAEPTVTEAIVEAPALPPTYWLDHWANEHPEWVGLEIASDISEAGAVSQSWTYRDLSLMSDRIAAFLNNSGLSKQRVAVCMGRSFIAYAIVAGIWKSGNCYLPVAEDLPPERQALLLSDSGSAVLFAEAASMSRLPKVSTDLRVVMVDDEDFPHRLPEKLEAVPDAHRDDNCYLLYTSGSTGTPKGVLVSRGNVSAFTEAQSDFICREVPDTRHLGGTGKYLAHASRAFDVHICEMVLAWRHGLALATAPRAMLLDDLRLALTTLGVTHSGFVPSLLDQAGLEARHVPRLRYLGVGGEKISQRIIDEFAASDLISLVNAYGPTEATIGISSINVTPSTNVRNIGKVVGNITAHVFRPGTFSYAKRAQAGELCVTGDLVANGYHRRPDAKGFVEFQGRRMYRTGDMVRLMADDCIEILGRSDSQAKVRGQRLELEEVSAAIAKCAAGAQVDVTSLVLPSPATGRPQLVAFVSRRRRSSAQRPAKADAAAAAPLFVLDDYREWAPAIIAGCKNVLPPYMVPSYVIPLTFIPIQISGKADVRQLRAVYEAIPRAQLVGGKAATALTNNKPANAPVQKHLSPVETRVRDVLRTILPFEPSEVSPATNILDLGIDSLNAIDLSIKLRKAGFTCSVADVLSRPLLSQLASIPFNGGGESETAKSDAQSRQKLLKLDAAFRAQNTNPRLPNASIQAVRPCLPLQESLVASSLNDDTKSLYVNHIILKLSPSIEIGKLRDAWLDSLADVDILRTCFEHLDGAMVQVVLKPRAASFALEEIPYADAEGWFTGRRKEVSADIMENIQAQPPYRLFAAAPGRGRPGVLMISIHHSIYDAVSMNLILDSVYAHYRGLTPRPQGDMEALYAHLLHHDAKEAEGFWKQYLKDFSPSYVSSKPRAEGEELKIVELALSAKLSSLSKQASAAMATLSSLIEAVLALTLAQSIGTDDVTIGRVLAGRAIPVPSADTLIVPLVTTIPSRTRCNSAPSSAASLQDVVAAVHHSNTAALAHQHTPLRHIQRWAGCPTPLFDVLYSFSRTSSSEPPTHAEAWTEEDESGVMAADYPLAVEVVADASSDTVTLRAGSTDGFGDEARTHTLLENVDLLLQASSAGEGGLEALRIADLHIGGGAGRTGPTPRERQWDERSWSPEARVMRRAVAELCGLGEDEVTKNASFFSLGLDSVTAIRFSKALKVAGLRVSSADVMKHTSIGALEHHLKETVQAKGKGGFSQLQELVLPVPAGVVEEDVLDSYWCTPLQASMVTQTLSSEGRLYVHHHAAALPADIDTDRLKDAWTKVVEQTDILRTSFHTTPSSRHFFAVVHKQPQPNWSEVMEADSIAQEIDKIVATSTYPTESAFRKPPLRATLLRPKSNIEATVLVITLHHALYDGHSVPLIFRDLATAYLGNPPVRRPPFSHAARHIAAAQARSRSDFWPQRLVGYRKASLPDRPGHTATDADGKLHMVEMSIASPPQTVLRACAAVGVTLQTAALLAFGKALARLSGRRDVVFGQVLAGRSLDGLEDAESVVGPLFNTVPFRLLLDAVLRTNRAVARDIQEFAADSQPHQHDALGEITKAWRKQTGDASSPRLFDALFVFLKKEEDGSENGAAVDELFQPWQPADADDFVPDDADYPMNFEFEQGPGKLVVRASCRDRHLTADGLRTFVGIFEATLEDVLTSPDRSAVAFPPGLKDLPVTAEREEEEAPQQSLDDVLPGPDLDAVRDGLAEVTQVPAPEIALASNVYALGLDSIAAIQVVALCRRRDVAVSVADILQGGTLGGIIRNLRKKHPPGQSSISTAEESRKASLVTEEVRASALGLLGVQPAAVEYVLRCLSGQLYHLAGWLNSARTLFEPTWAFSCKSRVDPERLRDAWWKLRRRHSILRTCFAAVSGEDVVQVALRPGVVERDAGFRQVSASSGDFLQSAKEEAKAIAASPSDLFSPPVRLCLLQSEEEGKDAILLTFHHATYDAWTMPLFLADLTALYNGDDKDLRDPPSFSTFVESSLNAPKAREESRQHWTRYLRHASPTILASSSSSEHHPTTTPSTAATPPRQLFVTAPAAIKNLAALDHRCRSNTAALHTTLLLAIARVLARRTAARNPTFGLYHVGRSTPSFPRVDEVSGPTLNLLPLVVRDALGGSSAAEGARRIREDLGGRMAREQDGLRGLVGKVVGESGVGVVGLCNVFVNLLWQRPSSVQPPPQRQQKHQQKKEEKNEVYEVEVAQGGLALELEPLLIGVPTDFAPKAAVAGKTAVDAMDCAWLRREDNVFVDVARNWETDAIDFGVRYEGEGMDEEDVRAFVGEIAGELVALVEGL